MISFNPLWQTMKRKNVTIYKLITTYGISRSTIDKLKHNKNITISTLNNLCNILDCDVNEIIEWTKDDE